MSVRVSRPFPIAALPRLWQWTEDFRHLVADDFAPRTLDEFVNEWVAAGPARVTWGVYRDEELGGCIVWEPGRGGVGVSHAVFKRTFWGRPTTRTALELAYDEVFQGGARKILGFPFADNKQIIGLGRALGARKEGTLRANSMRGGKPVSVVILGLMKEDFYTCRSSHQSQDSRAALEADSRASLEAERRSEAPPCSASAAQAPLLAA